MEKQNRTCKIEGLATAIGQPRNVDECVTEISTVT